ncbi:16S rRNA (cytosine(1402)-N(4))-methyltransferase RsmH [Candidatus Saccharibacteria bacterium]|nr:16S rRNA (cytosine(1402)-N(4))-methyltransferase RsmH [Candidatus Saccharibacteria bacterium]
MSNETKLHDPVLLEECLRLIAPKVGERYLDLTAGYGGHASAFLSMTRSYEKSTLVDRDAFAISSLKGFAEQGTEIIHSSFRQATEKLVEKNQKFDIILIDLGVSSPQLDFPDRGFSFSKSGPLDMRMDQSQPKSAFHIVNHARESELAEIFVQFGEEKKARATKIARAIINSRPIQTTDQLAALVAAQARHKSRSRRHPATRIFQAIRIAVNDEITEIQETLPLIQKLLASGGRFGVISFHSLEDKLVKDYLKSDADLGLESQFHILTKKPIDGETYDVHNPRARSAKLRVAMKK